MTRKRILAITALSLLTVVCAAFSLDQWGRRDEWLDHADAIVVLGCALEADDTPGGSLAARTEHAVKLWRAHRAPRLLFSGNDANFQPSQAQAAAHLAHRMGVPRAAMLTEDQSRDTWENAQFSAQILKQHGWSRILLVSDPSHLWRASRHFRRLGMTVAVSGADEADALGTPLRFHKAFREVVSVTRDVLFLRYWR